MTKNKTISIEGAQITIISNESKQEYISLTDMARSQMQEVVIIKWLSLKSTIEYLGEWEALYNPDFNYTEFGTIKNEADLLNVALFGKTAKHWRDASTSSATHKTGNIRDEATLEQLVVLSNMESINSLLIQQGLAQSERLIQLNTIAISQMKSLLGNMNLKKLNE